MKKKNRERVKHIKKIFQALENKVAQVSWDWKENPDVVADDMIDAIQWLYERGAKTIYKYIDPLTEGSDTYGYILSAEPLDHLSKKQLKKLSLMIVGLEFEV